LSTNFLPLPSGGFIASQPQPCYTLSRFPTLVYGITACNFDQRFLSLTGLSSYANTITSTLTAVPATVIFADFLCPFHGLVALRPKGSLKGIRLLIIANHPEYREAPGALLGVLVVGFFCLPSKLTGGVL